MNVLDAWNKVVFSEANMANWQSLAYEVDKQGSTDAFFTRLMKDLSDILEYSKNRSGEVPELLRDAASLCKGASNVEDVFRRGTNSFFETIGRRLSMIPPVAPPPVLLDAPQRMPQQPMVSASSFSDPYWSQVD